MSRLRTARAGLFAAFGLACAFALALAPSIAAADDLPFRVRTHKLKNGLTLMLAPYGSPGLLAYYSVVKVGSRDETEKGVTGFAHFFEHMMFRGTQAWPPERVQAYLRKAGADQNGFTTDDFTAYTFFGRSDDLEELVEMEADRFKDLQYSEDVFKTESKAVLGEYNKSASSPQLILRERQREKVFTTHTYGHTTLGYLKDIEDMPNQYAYSRTFFERFYTPDNTTIVAVGDFDPDKLVALIEKHYSDWNRRRAKSDVSPEPAQKAAIRESIEWPTPTMPILSLSWRTPATSFASKDTAIYNVLFELLFGKVSPLYNKLVLEDQLVVDFDDSSWNHRDPYLFHVLARVRSPEAFAKVEEAVEAQLAELREGKLDEKRLAAVKSNVRYATLLDLDTPDRIANTLAFVIGAGGDADSLDELLETIDAIDVDDVERFARLYLDARQKSVVMVAPKGGAS